MAGDGQTIARVAGRQTLGIRWVSHILQRRVVEFLRDPAVRAKLAKAERAYKERREALIGDSRPWSTQIGNAFTSPLQQVFCGDLPHI